MKVSPKKLTVCKFGVTLYPTKEYYAERNANHIRVQVDATCWVGGFQEKDLVIKQHENPSPK